MCANGVGKQPVCHRVAGLGKKHVENDEAGMIRPQPVDQARMQTAVHFWPLAGSARDGPLVDAHNDHIGGRRLRAEQEQEIVAPVVESWPRRLHHTSRPPAPPATRPNGRPPPQRRLDWNSRALIRHSEAWLYCAIF